MRIVGLPILEAYKKKHADVRGQLDAWQVDVERQNWGSSHDIRQRYGSADFLADNRVIFDIKGNEPAASHRARVVQKKTARAAFQRTDTSQ